MRTILGSLLLAALTIVIGCEDQDVKKRLAKQAALCEEHGMDFASGSPSGKVLCADRDTRQVYLFKLSQ